MLMLISFLIGCHVQQPKHWRTYYSLRQVGSLAWLPGDYVVSPAIMFAKVRKSGNSYEGETLPITFDGHIEADMCAILQSFYGATR
jgi:hypothetical protein